MKSIEALEALLKRYYREQKRAIQPDESFDRKVLERALAKQAESGNISGNPMRRLVLGAVAAAAIVAAAFVIQEWKASKAELAPQKEFTEKMVSSEAVSNAGLPTLFQVNLILREKGLEEACKRLTYVPKGAEPGTSLRTRGMLRMGMVSNGS